MPRLTTPVNLSGSSLHRPLNSFALAAKGALSLVMVLVLGVLAVQMRVARKPCSIGSAAGRMADSLKGGWFRERTAPCMAQRIAAAISSAFIILVSVAE
jgi:hypothetical protein